MIEGLLLAAGAGRRMGTPKALVGDWLPASIEVLLGGGCSHVTVVLGARAEEAGDRVPRGVDVVVADDWAAGMGASLRAGLAALSGPDGALVHLVDLPDVGPEVVARVIEAGASAGAGALARASYHRTPGHPVLLGRDHWAGAGAAATGDQGARGYLLEHDVVLVECGDLATGADVDGPTERQRPRQ